MNRPNETDRRLRNSILDLLCYYSVFNTALTDEQILSLLSVRASMVGVRSHLRMLQKRGKVVESKNGLYSIKKIKYANQTATARKQQKKTAELRKNIRFIKFLPFVRAVVATSDSLLESGQAKELPKLIIVCSPNRIYLTMEILSMLNKFLDIFMPRRKRAFIDPFPMFFTTAGLRFVDQIGYDELSRIQWFGYSKPLSGELVWDGVLRNNELISKNLPNYSWKKQETKYITSFSQTLDNYDNSKYRSWLRKMADNGDYKKESALLRVRPDTFIAREHHLDQLKNLQDKLSKNRSFL